MSLEDRLLDSLASLKSYTFTLADTLDRKADALANTIRSSLTNTPWLPESARPHLPPPRLIAPPPSWAYQHRHALGLGLAAATLAGGYTLHLRRRPRKRRARRASNGARKEVVVVAGSPHDAVTRSLAADLEHRGFIVFVVVGSLDDEQTVSALGGRDLRPLHLDLLDPSAAAAAAARFGTYLSTPVVAFPGAQPHALRLAAVVLVGGSDFPAGPVESLPAPDWSDTLNLRVLAPVLTVQHFLPLLRASPGARLLVLSPAIVAALALPFHAPEAAAVAALDGFAATLRRELKPLGVPVVQMRLGTFDLAKAQGANAARADIVQWPSGLRGAYARSYAALEMGRAVRGSPLRELHLAVFDALTGKVGREVCVGSGSRVYSFVGRWMPDWLVGGMLGVAGARRGGVDLERGVVGGGSGSGSGGSSGSERSLEWEKV
ncbi:hypothetical protein EDC01DRAFT_609833 [Geopyxis carbonaria]|nr:hypothetical protein EDC01DRAFT_609833 [Geopyxis carbonaria]